MFETITSNYFGASHIGHIRDENQDVWRALEGLGAFFLADGMGGRNAGKLAAEMAVEIATQRLLAMAQTLPVDPTEATVWLKEAVGEANRQIYFKAQESEETFGMGTTLAALWLLPEYAVILNVGDSRIYRLRGKDLDLLSVDHVVPTTKDGVIIRNMLSQAVGTSQQINPHTKVLKHTKGDLFLLCSDGLTGALSDREIKTILTKPDGLDIMASLLVQGSLAHGGKDNTTVIVVQV